MCVEGRCGVQSEFFVKLSETSKLFLNWIGEYKMRHVKA